MYTYNNYRMPRPNYNDEGDRFFPLLFPFIGGAIIGGAAVGLSRPRPVYVNPYPMPYYPYGYNYGNYGYYNYR